jgi:serine protease inhibitor
MKHYRAAIALSLAITLLPVFTASPAEEAQAGLKKAAEGNNEFAVDLYRKLAVPGRNLFVSPLSIGTAFAMASAGARGDTLKEIGLALRFKTTGDDLAASWSGLLADLRERAKAGKFQLSAANRIWIESQFELGKAFVKTMKKSFDAALKQVNFAGDPEAARGEINDWVAQQTNKKITGLVPPGAVTGATSLVLTNAVYFMGAWDQPFDEKLTRPAEFLISPTKKADVPMMKHTGYFRYAEYDDLFVVSLPYRTESKKDEALSLLVLLPKKLTGLADIEKKLTAANLSRWLDGMGVKEVVLELPRFEVTTFTGLSEPLKKMGMKTAFTPDADFSGMAPKLFISEAFHKAYVSVNEKGTEAAAATAITIVKANGGKKHPFRADHPFIFAIRDDHTGALLFIGRVIDPLAR